jgi:hypothetical protein
MAEINVDNFHSFIIVEGRREQKGEKGFGDINTL